MLPYLTWQSAGGKWRKKKCIFFSSIVVSEDIPTQNQPNALEGNQIISHTQSSLSKPCIYEEGLSLCCRPTGHAEFHRPFPAFNHSRKKTESNISCFGDRCHTHFSPWAIVSIAFEEIKVVLFIREALKPITGCTWKHCFRRRKVKPSLLLIHALMHNFNMDTFQFLFLSLSQNT